MTHSLGRLRSPLVRRAGIPSLAALAALASIGAPRIGAAQAGSAAPAKTRLVIIEDMRFKPQTLVVRRGERVKWVNKDLFPHTVTAVDASFDSHAIAAGGSWTFVAKKAGTYHYTCTFHPTMTGKLEVR